MTKQLKIGALLSYFTIVFNIVAGLVYTPWMITKIGQDNYGLYTLATSLISLFVMDFGMSSAVGRFVSKYNAEGNQQKVNDFLGLVYKIYFAIDTVIFAVLIVIYFFVEFIYGNLAPAEIETLKTLYIIVGLFSVVSFPFTNLNGILTSYERFTELKLCDFFHKVFIIVSMVIALFLGYGVHALVLVNAVSGLITIVLKLLVINKKTSVNVNFNFFDKNLIKEIFSFSAWTTVVSVMQRLTINISPSIIVAVSAAGSVGSAVFGLATTIEGYVYTFAGAINGLFLPRISKIISGGKKEELLMPLMIKVGRIQFMVVGLLTVGFVAFGHSFILEIWNKPDFSESYICAILLIIPSLFYLPMQIANTTIVVENKVKLQAYVFMIMGILNVIISFPLSNAYGAIGASASILISYMVRAILMTIVFEKHLGLNMKVFFNETYLSLSPYLLIVLVVGLMCEKFNPIGNAFFKFVVNGIIFVSTFYVCMILKGFNEYERSLVSKLLFKLLRKKRI